MNTPSTNNRLTIFVSTGSSGLMISFSTLVGSTSNLQDFQGSEVIKGIADILLRRLKFRMSIKCVPDFFDFVHKESSKFFCQLLITGGGGRELGFLLPVIVLMRLNHIFVSLPASVICKERVCVFVLIMAMYLFLSTHRAVH